MALNFFANPDRLMCTIILEFVVGYLVEFYPVSFAIKLAVMY